LSPSKINAGVNAPIKVALAIEVARTAMKPITIDAPKKQPGTTHAFSDFQVTPLPHQRLARYIAGTPSHIRNIAVV
jgi:hypothetical protein